ncbi:hypothetical protein BT63DRAFT_455987 [Microthyrium microscopicum]|uniref:Mid2 domain-containing protein n=1 Tax=Microthyrium microscopicum TaxID=703497 RepID=A0A6A6UB69_9PEZI|nr:hypothetical protein BT63DRAFT_455987 [Microthyrium microscopicum]
MSAIRSFLLACALLGPAMASPLVERQATTSTTSTASLPSSAMVETTISGVKTSVYVAMPTDSSTSTSGSTASQTSSASSPTGSVSESPSVPDSTATSCKNTIEQPICAPHEGQELQVGTTYWVQWSTSAFPTNTSIQLVLQSTNNTSVVVWKSDTEKSQAGYTFVTIDKAWLNGYSSDNFTLIWSAYGSQQPSTSRQTAFNVTLTTKLPEHYPAPPPTKMPSKESLLIGLPAALGSLLIVALGLFCGMRHHRRIGLGSVMGRKKGYVSGKSRRQRLGQKKGAIRLEDREVAPTTAPAGVGYHDDDAINAAPRQTGWVTAPRMETYDRDRNLSLGSLVADEEPNAFRKEIHQQRTGM